MMIALKDIEMDVETIRILAEEDNFEQAHKLEDALHRGVLRSIAARGENPVLGGRPSACALAKAALATTEIDFLRVYA